MEWIGLSRVSLCRQLGIKIYVALFLFFLPDDSLFKYIYLFKYYEYK